MTTGISRRRLLSAAILLAVLLPACGRNTAPLTIGLVWEDDFDGDAGQSPDSGKWGFDIGTGSNGWGNAQLEYDTNRPENVSMDGDGHLAIVARKETYGASAYTSARIKTQGRFEQARGRFEARIKLPVGQGIWPAFWLLGNDITSVGWPACGEIDIMEYRGQYPNLVAGSLHGPGYSGGSPISSTYRLPDGAFNDDFHVFAIEWESDRITWFVDDVAYHEAGTEDLGGNPWVFNHPFFIILNVAVGGYYVGNPDQSTVFPQTMLVDWVRVYNTTD